MKRELNLILGTAREISTVLCASLPKYISSKSSSFLKDCDFAVAEDTSSVKEAYRKANFWYGLRKIKTENSNQSLELFVDDYISSNGYYCSIKGNKDASSIIEEAIFNSLKANKNFYPEKKLDKDTLLIAEIL